MKMLKNVFTVAALIGLFAFSGSALAAKPTNPGGGGKTPPDYGDLFVLYRDANGVPYVTEYIDGEGGMCQQPLPSTACPSVESGCRVDGQTYINGVEIDETGTVEVVNVDPATCGVPPECAICTQEVEFERDNVIRAKESVLEQQLQDATIKLATAGCITLDPAGRPVASNVMEGAVVSSAIDSPLQNLAFYKKLMSDGYVGSAASPIDLRTDDYLVSAARALGASAPKEGNITVDTIVYMNEILGLTKDGASQLPRISQVVREEVKGVMTEVTKWFLDYGDGDEYPDYEYDRITNFNGDLITDGLPAPAYMPPVPEPLKGWFEYVVKVVNSDGTISYNPVYGFILEAVFPSPSGYEGTLLEAFAQAADDTRAVINFMHTYPVLDEDVTPIDCGGSTTPEFYDVSISERSGLQVPVRMAAAGDGREGSVTVDNGGPATAEDICIMVSGEDNDGEKVNLFEEMGSSTVIFEECEMRTIVPGYPETITFFFVMDEAATITWTATAYALDNAENDVNWNNNTVEETTIVNKPKGGGGGH